jgi:2'-5' RNA ligase
MKSTRQQLTLFVSPGNDVIETIRATLNPVQHSLIAAHVTLCREDEIDPIEHVIENIRTVRHEVPLCITFNPILRFNNGNGVLMPAEHSDQFQLLRRSVLKGIQNNPRHHDPHITLMHPRNSTCTDTIFSQLKTYTLPDRLYFDTISLIEQRNGGKWIVADQFKFVSS